MKRLLLGLLILGLMVGMSGCGKDKPTEPSREELLIGVWGWEMYNGHYESWTQSTMTLYEDKTYRRILLVLTSGSSFTQTGTWKVKGQLQLVLNELKITFNQNWIDLLGSGWEPEGEIFLDYTLEEDKLTLVNSTGILSNYERK
mgnify:CR=1 FL=1